MSDNRKVALVTGSSSGIGEATAELLCKESYRVVITGSSESKVDQVVKRLKSLCPFNNNIIYTVKHNGVDANHDDDKSHEHIFGDDSVIGIVSDLSNLENASNIIDKVIARFGRLDLLVNNVGMYRDTNSIDKSSFEVYERMMLINVSSVIKTTSQAIPHLEKTQGTIIFVSSVASVRPRANNYAYRVSKAAISSYAKCLAIDVAPLNIRVNIVSPGPVDTPLLKHRSKASQISVNGLSNGTHSPTKDINTNGIQANRNTNKNEISTISGAGQTNGYSNGYTNGYINGAAKTGEILVKSAPPTLINRIGQPEEVANVISFLASDKASYIYGTEIFVDGGYLTK